MYYIPNLDDAVYFEPENINYSAAVGTLAETAANCHQIAVFERMLKRMLNLENLTPIGNS